MSANQPTKKQKKAITISLISGKGGVGKTAISSSLSVLLSKLGFNVLLIDADLTTHGLTYFFFDDITNKKEALRTDNMMGLIIEHQKNYESYQNKLSKIDGAAIHSGLKIIPSISDLGQSNINPVDSIKPNVIESVLKDILEKTSLKFDFIIIDMQAGALAATKASIELSQKVITVLEADPVGVWAAQMLERKLPPSSSGQTQTYYLVNKLFFEEIAQYKALTNYSSLFSYLPPLPFDFEVKKAFSRRVIPIDFNKPSAFLFAMIRLSKDLVPLIQEKLNQLEDDLTQKSPDNIQEKITHISQQIEKTQLSILEVQGKQRVRIWLAIYLVMITFFFVSIFVLREYNLNNIVSEVFLELLILILLPALTSILLDSQKVKDAFWQEDAFWQNNLARQLLGPAHLTSQTLRLEVEDLMARRRTLETLLLTRKP